MSSHIILPVSYRIVSKIYFHVRFYRWVDGVIAVVRVGGIAIGVSVHAVMQKKRHFRGYITPELAAKFCWESTVFCSFTIVVKREVLHRKSLVVMRDIKYCLQSSIMLNEA